jgi:hypothetical protein
VEDNLRTSIQIIRILLCSFVMQNNPGSFSQNRTFFDPSGFAIEARGPAKRVEAYVEHQICKGGLFNRASFQKDLDRN